MKKEVKNKNLKNVTYLPSVEQKIYFEMLDEFDIGLFSLHPDHKTHNFPGKILGYMAYSKPILGCVNIGNDLKEIVNDSGSGFIVDSESETELYISAIQLIESEELRVQMGKNGKQLLTNLFSVENACMQIERTLK